MKIKLSIFSSLFLFLFIFSPSYIKADFIPPAPRPPCDYEEDFFNKDEINPNLYQNIRRIIPEKCEAGKPCPSTLNTTFDGYCVNLSEYCSKNKCDKLLLIKLYDISISKIPQISFGDAETVFYIIINFLINTVLLLIILHYSDLRLKQFFNLERVVLIILVTVLGYIADILAMLFSGGLIDLMENIAIQFIRFIPATIINSFAIGLLTFLMVFFIFYITFAKTMFYEKGKRVKAALFYALISNPLWFLLIKTIFK